MFHFLKLNRWQANERKRQFCRSFDPLGAKKSTASTFNVLRKSGECASECMLHIEQRSRIYSKTYKCNYVKVLILKQPESLCQSFGNRNIFSLIKLRSALKFTVAALRIERTKLNIFTVSHFRCVDRFRLVFCVCLFIYLSYLCSCFSLRFFFFLIFTCYGSLEKMRTLTLVEINSPSSELVSISFEIYIELQRVRLYYNSI